MLSGGGTGRLCRPGSEKGGRGSARGNVDVGSSALGDGFLSGLAMSEKGRGCGADVKGDGKPGAWCTGAEDGGGAYNGVFLSENTSEMEGRD